MMIDILTFMLPEPWFSDHYHLQAKAHPIYGLNQDSWMWQIKSQSGFPWDGDFYDNLFVYQNITEGAQGWQDPTSYKVFTSKSYPGGHGGIGWAPRFFNPDHKIDDLITEDTSYDTWLNGNKIASQDLGGPCIVSLELPKPEIIGDLGLQLCIHQSYKWGKDLENEERNVYARNLGWVRWQLWEHGKMANESVFDQVREGGTPQLTFPASLP
jgi:hypothetical protein